MRYITVEKIHPCSNYRIGARRIESKSSSTKVADRVHNITASFPHMSRRERLAVATCPVFACDFFLGMIDFVVQAHISNTCRPKPARRTKAKVRRLTVILFASACTHAIHYLTDWYSRPTH